MGVAIFSFVGCCAFAAAFYWRSPREGEDAENHANLVAGLMLVGLVGVSGGVGTLLGWWG